MNDCDKTQPCQNYECRHNLLFVGLKFKKAHENELSRESNNCELQIKRDYILEEIGQIWGISRERVRQIERDAITKFLMLLLENSNLAQSLDLDRNKILEKINQLRDKKFNTGNKSPRWRD